MKKLIPFAIIAVMFVMSAWSIYPRPLNRIIEYDSRNLNKISETRTQINYDHMSVIMYSYKGLVP